MLKQFWGYLEPRYRRQAILTPIFILAEVFMEVFIPLQMAKVINLGVNLGDINAVLVHGGAMVVMALLSLLFGILAAKTSVNASVGFAKNIRQALFHKVQDFSFANVDRFSTASLVTRLTTDVTNVQMAFMMCIRMLVRSPVMLVSATFMAAYISPKLALIFLVVIPVLGGLLGVIAAKTFPRFQVMLAKYDALNARVQENLTAIRVVKAFVREDYEIEKFDTSADEVRDTMVRAEKLPRDAVLHVRLYDRNFLVWRKADHRRLHADWRPDELYQLCVADFDVSHDAVHDFCHAAHVQSVGLAYFRGAQREA